MEKLALGDTDEDCFSVGEISVGLVLTADGDTPALTVTAGGDGTTLLGGGVAIPATAVGEVDSSLGDALGPATIALAVAKGLSPGAGVTTTGDDVGVAGKTDVDPGDEEEIMLATGEEATNDADALMAEVDGV